VCDTPQVLTAVMMYANEVFPGLNEEMASAMGITAPVAALMLRDRDINYDASGWVASAIESKIADDVPAGEWAANMAAQYGDYPVPLWGNGGPDTSIVYRLREGVERFLIKDINNPAATSQAQSTSPIMWDRIDANADLGRIALFNHVPGGCNVLYMDGHVEFLKYKAKHPITWATAWTGGR